VDTPTIRVLPHPALELAALAVQLPRPLGELSSPDWLLALLRPDAAAPLRPAEEVRSAVRELLRSAGYRPTGRGKPSAEYLQRAAQEGRLAGINLLVDAGNAASLHSGLPISVVDRSALTPPLRVELAAPGSAFVFNRAGQSIEVGSLLCLHDDQGPCANAVKDSQRSKTGAATERALVLVWGTRLCPGRAAATSTWVAELLARAGATTGPVNCA
jgi:DNA/RNA-binding domain of Phe-tRNA-synthetase-like protein